jgi:hypothetical protein
MTLYAYSLNLFGNDIVPLEAAVKAYMKRCRAEIRAGNTHPFRWHLDALKEMMTGLRASETLLSRYVPAKDGKPARIELGDKLFEPKPKGVRATKRKKTPRRG